MLGLKERHINDDVRHVLSIIKREKNVERQAVLRGVLNRSYTVWVQTLKEIGRSRTQIVNITGLSYGSVRHREKTR